MKIALYSWGRERFTLLRTFSLVSAVILIIIAVVLARNLQAMLENSALQQESSLAIGEAQTLLHGGLLTRAATGDLSPLDLQRLANYTWQNMGYVHDVRVKIWSRNGTILYSDAPSAIGRRFPVDGDMSAVLSGQVPSASDISDLTAPENATERGQFSNLLEVYVPIPGAPGSRSKVVGAYEVYHDLTFLDAQEATMRRTVGMSVTVGFLALYVSLFLLVRSASRRLIRQDRENVRLLEESQRREAGALLLYRAGEQLRAGTDREGVLQGVLDTVCKTMGYLRCTVLQYDANLGKLIMSNFAGVGRLGAHDRAIPIGTGLIGRSAANRTAVLSSDMQSGSRPLPEQSGVPDEIALPLLAGDELLGVFHVTGKQGTRFGERDRTLLSVVADQVALAIQNSNLFAERESLYLATLDAMARTIDARDPYTAGHSHRVANYAVAVGKRLGVDDDMLTSLQRGGALHDIGKVGLADAILRKPGPLTDEERAEMMRHPSVGFDLLRNMSFLGAALDMVRYHHERWDGLGYPAKLHGEQIPIGARIMAVSDAFDTMSSDRPYREALPLAEARARLLEGANTQFWAPAVDALVALLDEGTVSPAIYRAANAEVAAAG
jgi:putative methionine-R-sulfoxide reductase with GAF domain